MRQIDNIINKKDLGEMIFRLYMKKVVYDFQIEK